MSGDSPRGALGRFFDGVGALVAPRLQRRRQHQRYKGNRAEREVGIAISNDVVLCGEEEARQRASDDLPDDERLAQKTDGGGAGALRRFVGDDVARRCAEQLTESGTRDDHCQQREPERTKAEREDRQPHFGEHRSDQQHVAASLTVESGCR